MAGMMQNPNALVFTKIGSGGMILGLSLACVAGLSSCGLPQNGVDRVKVPVVRRAAHSEIEMKAYLFTAPDDFSFVKGQDKPGVAGIYSSEEGGKLADSLARRRGFDLIHDQPIASTTKSGQKRELKLTREFIYPTEYRPPVLAKGGDDVVRLESPATPVAFDSKDLGVVLSYRVKRLADGMLDVELDLERGCFLGFVNYGSPIKGKQKGLFGREVEVTLSENRIEMPVFDVKRFNGRVKVREGDFIAVGGMMPGKAPKQYGFQPWKGGPPESNEKNFVALLQVKAGPAK